MKRVVCPVCSHELTANTDNELVTNYMQHANQNHQMHLTMDQARQQVMQQLQQAETTGRMGQGQGTGRSGKTGM